jgi:hypothetical protein
MSTKGFSSHAWRDRMRAYNCPTVMHEFTSSLLLFPLASRAITVTTGSDRSSSGTAASSTSGALDALAPTRRAAPPNASVAAFAPSNAGSKSRWRKSVTDTFSDLPLAFKSSSSLGISRLASALRKAWFASEASGPDVGRNSPVSPTQNPLRKIRTATSPDASSALLQLAAVSAAELPTGRQHSHVGASGENLVCLRLGHHDGRIAARETSLGARQPVCTVRFAPASLTAAPGKVRLPTARRLFLLSLFQVCKRGEPSHVRRECQPRLCHSCPLSPPRAASNGYCGASTTCLQGLPHSFNPRA